MRLLILFISFCMVNVCFAIRSPEPTSFTLTIINHSQQSLRFMGNSTLRNSTPFTSVGFPMETLLPGGSLTLTATPLLSRMGIKADLNFQDMHGNGNLLHINNPCQIEGIKPAPVASLENNTLIAFVANQSLNNTDDPAALLLDSATVEIEDKM